MTYKHLGRRTSLIVDPPNGRVPPLTAEAQALADTEREWRRALLRSTETCELELPACSGQEYNPTPSPRRSEPAPRYNTNRVNRHDDPEDGAFGDRCLLGHPVEFGSVVGGSFRRIIQTQGGITMYYDQGQGQGFQRSIVMDGRPHLPDTIRQWFGDSRAHWEGDTLVIDVTNFSPKQDLMGSRENLHLVERWTRTGPDTLAYEVTIEDPTVWVQPWTVKQDFQRQSDQENRIYYEPRCHEGNYGFPALLKGARVNEEAYAAGTGPHPATFDNATGSGLTRFPGNPIGPRAVCRGSQSGTRRATESGVVGGRLTGLIRIQLTRSLPLSWSLRNARTCRAIGRVAPAFFVRRTCQASASPFAKRAMPHPLRGGIAGVARQTRAPPSSAERS